MPLTKESRALARWSVAAYTCIAVAMLSVLGMVAWGVTNDLAMVRATLLQSEMNRLRTHAMRTMAMLEDYLHEQKPPRMLGDLADSEIAAEHRAYWAEAIYKDDSRAYAGIVDSSGKIVFHSHRDREGLNIGRKWYDHVVPVAGDDVVETGNPALTGGEMCLDVHLPIIVDHREVGQYHSGLSGEWLEKTLTQMQRATWHRWAVLLGTMVSLLLLAGASLFYITRRVTTYRQAAKLARAQRFAEIGQLMAGIVHEIRNPLNAMRLNLHVLRRYRYQLIGDAEDQEMFATDPETIINETDGEIGRIEELLRALVGYCRSDQTREETFNVAAEIATVLGFMRQTLETSGVAVHLQAPANPAMIRIDRNRFRQVIRNLVSNAKDAVGHGGTVRINVRAEEETVEISIDDDGPGIPPADRERVFEPFFSTKEASTGLGLALVKRFVEEAGGRVACERNMPAGAKFIVRLHEVHSEVLNPAIP